MKFPRVKLAALAIGFALASTLGYPQSQRYAALDWTSTNFQAAFEDFFPIRHADGDFIAIRAHQNGSNVAPEFSFVLEDTQDSREIRATLRQAQGASLYQQLAALHAKNPSESYADMRAELKVQTWNFTAAACPAVPAQFKAFENIQFVRPRDEDEPDENPIVYEINETVAGGSSQVIEFMPNRAIPRWAEATRKALLTCSTQSSTTSP